MRKIALITTTYLREKLLKKMIKSIKNDLEGNYDYAVTHYIVKDGGEPYKKIESKQELINYKIHFKDNEFHRGVGGYWDTYNIIFEVVKEEWSEFVIFLPDDCYVCKDFFKRLFDTYERSLHNTGCDVILRFFLDNRIWTKLNGIPNQMIDGICLLRYEHMERWGWKLMLADTSKGSSGVWRQISKCVLRKNKHAKIFYTDYSLVYHTSPKDSLINPEERAKDPLKTKRWIENYKNPKIGLIDMIHGIDVGKVEPFKRWGRVIYSCQEGLGNVLETVPTFLNLLLLYERVDYYYHFRPDKDNLEKLKPLKEIVEYCGGSLFVSEEEIEKVGHDEFRGLVTSYQNNEVKGVRTLMNCGDRTYINEVKRNFQAFAKLKPVNIDSVFMKRVRGTTPLNWKQIRGNRYGGKDLKKFDFVLYAGGFRSGSWDRKRYKKWKDVVDELIGRDFTVASVGLSADGDWVEGTEDLTDIGLLETCDLINECKTAMGNDCGLYHFANLIGKENIVVFTATNKKKNCNANGMHRFAHVVSTDCTCQEDDWSRGNKWKDCSVWRCAEFDHMEIVAEAFKIKGVC